MIMHQHSVSSQKAVLKKALGKKRGTYMHNIYQSKYVWICASKGDKNPMLSTCHQMQHVLLENQKGLIKFLAFFLVIGQLDL